MDPAGVSTGSTLRRFTQFALRQNLLPKRFKIAKKLRGRRVDAEIVNRAQRVRPSRTKIVSAPSGISRNHFDAFANSISGLVFSCSAPQSVSVA